MKVRVDPIILILGSIFLGWGWNELMIDDEPICPVIEVHKGKTVIVSYYCKDVLEE